MVVARSRGDSCGYVGVDVARDYDVIVAVLTRCHSILFLSRVSAPCRMVDSWRDDDLRGVARRVILRSSRHPTNITTAPSPRISPLRHPRHS
jgi:hypothetical protein